MSNGLPPNRATTIAALLKSLGETPPVENPAGTDLKEFQSVIEDAHSRNLRWHLAIDY